MTRNQLTFRPAVPLVVGVLLVGLSLAMGSPVLAQVAPTPPPANTPATPDEPLPVLPGEGLPLGVVQVKTTEQARTNPDIVRNALTNAGIKEGQIFRNNLLGAARRAILDKGFYTEVYFRSEITGDKRVTLTVDIFENPIITRVTVSGNSKIIDPTRQILPFLDSKPGEVVNVNTVRDDARKIQRIYRNLGYDAYLSELQEVFDTKTGTLTFPVTETVVDSIVVEGLKKTRTEVVTREMRTKVGEPLNINILQRDIQRVFNTGLFGNVEQPRIEPLEEGKVKITVQVAEQRTGQVQVGFGYSQRQRLTGTLELGENNFRGRGQSVTASWTVSGAVSKNQYDFGFTEPWVDKNNTSLSVNVYDRLNFRFNSALSNAIGSNSDKQYYEENKGVTLSLGRPVSEFSRVFASLRVEGVKANSDVKPDWNKLTNEEINSIRGSLVQNGHVQAISLRSVTNTRDNELDPAAGYYFTPIFEIGTGQFDTQKPYINPNYISDTATPNVPRVLVEEQTRRGPFTKLSADTRRYIRLSPTPRTNIRDPKKTLATRLLVGTATGNIGFSEQYFIGGADTLRGFNDDRFWGNNIFLGSVELRIPVDKGGTVTGVLFTDVGSAWGASGANKGNVPGFSQTSGFSPRFGVGFGVRVKTPVGPVRLDYGIGETKRTHFSIGQAF